MPRFNCVRLAGASVYGAGEIESGRSGPAKAEQGIALIDGLIWGSQYTGESREAACCIEKIPFLHFR